MFNAASLDGGYIVKHQSAWTPRAGGLWISVGSDKEPFRPRVGPYGPTGVVNSAFREVVVGPYKLVAPINQCFGALLKWVCVKKYRDIHK